MNETQAENNERRDFGVNTLLSSLHWQAGWGNVSIAALGLFNLIVLSSTLSAMEFGQWGVFITGISFLELIRTGLVQSSLIRFSGGLNEEEERPYLSASLWLGVLITVVLLLLLALVQQLVTQAENDAFYLLINLAPVHLVAAFPLIFALWCLNAHRKFIFSFRIRLLVFGFFTLFVVIHSLSHFSVVQLAILYIAGHAIASVLCLYNGLTDLAFLQQFPQKNMRDMLQFGRYAMGSASMLNLIKSADTLLIGALAQIEWVAIYHLPIRLTEWSDLLIRSMIANAYPRLTAIYNTKPIKQMKRKFRRILGMYAYTTFLISILPALIMFAAAFILADRAHLWIWIFLSLATLWAPFYRFAGMGLEALHLPKKNFISLLTMLAITLIGDVLAIVYFDSLIGVAIVSLVAYFIGIALGYVWLNRELRLEPSMLFKQSHRWLLIKWRFWLKQLR